MSVTVNPVGDVADDSLTTNEDTPGTVNVLTNDTFAGAATVSAVTQGANGTVAIGAGVITSYSIHYTKLYDRCDVLVFVFLVFLECRPILQLYGGKALVAPWRSLRIYKQRSGAVSSADLGSDGVLPILD